MRMSRMESCLYIELTPKVKHHKTMRSKFSELLGHRVVDRPDSCSPQALLRLCHEPNRTETT
ncbi:hypothetical protein HanPSC8_Chr09g0367601 [Helianthus annuus]|nr:hypothetical protein HanPSC8_Chr09g0367601 [Helianthus annuus]